MLWLLKSDFAEQFLPKFYENKEQAKAYSDSYNAATNIKMGDSSVSVIDINGVLQPSGVSYYGTTYQEIIEKVAIAESSPSIQTILLAINSPGGSVDGIIPAMDAIKNAKKPIYSVVIDRATSAAYMLASQSKKIYSLTNLSEVGSVGVVVEFFSAKDMLEREGIKFYSFTNTLSPNKRMDLTTEAGKESLVSHLDEIYLELESKISAGRNVSAEFIRKNYGKGKVMLSKEAILNNMVDGIFDIKNFSSSKKLTENFRMSEATNKLSSVLELRAAHPELVAKLESESYENGVKAEKRRVSGWVKFISVDAKEVQDGILSGEAIDASSAAILASKMNQVSAVEARKAENVQAVAHVSKQDEKNVDAKKEEGEVDQKLLDEIVAKATARAKSWEVK
jgi:ClpP class serine protease